MIASAHIQVPVLTNAQKQALVLAWRAGDHYGIGITFAAIVWQESELCENAVESSAHAYGCAQLKEAAVKRVTGHKIPSWELLAPELQDENMAIGARYLDICMSEYGWPDGIACYYMGEGAAHGLTHKQREQFWYTKAVLAKMKLLRQLPVSEE